MLSEKAGKKRYAENGGYIAATCRAEWSGKWRKKTEKIVVGPRIVAQFGI
jgi:hypothetical protein